MESIFDLHHAELN